MEIIEYEEKYAENVKDLLVELQEHLVEVDYWHFQVMKESYRENCFKRDMEAVRTREGKIYLAKENDVIVGLVIGTIPPKDDEDRDTNTCARNGRVLELIVSKKSRGKGTGELLLQDGCRDGGRTGTDAPYYALFSDSCHGLIRCLPGDGLCRAV